MRHPRPVALEGRVRQSQVSNILPTPAGSVRAVEARAITVAVVAMLLLPATALAQRDEPPANAALPSSDGPRATAQPGSCPGDGDPFAPDKVITGEVESEREGSYVFLPFDVPDETTAVRVRYCYDQPEAPASQFDNNTLDLGLYEPRADESRPWGPQEFRGWAARATPTSSSRPRGSAARRGTRPTRRTRPRVRRRGRSGRARSQAASGRSSSASPRSPRGRPTATARSPTASRSS